MRHILVLFIALLSVCSSTFAAPKQIRVKTPEEFFKALGDNREIIVTAEDGLLLTPTLEFMIDDGKVKEYYEGAKPGFYYIFEDDGPQIVLVGYKNLSMRGDGKAFRRTIEVTPRYAFVFQFLECENLSLTDLYIGHTESGYCTNGVLGFRDCTNVSMTNCGLFGCGTEGITAYSSSNFKIINSEIFKCAYSILTLNDCYDFSFKNCYFYENKEFDQVNIGNTCNNILFEHCAFVDNLGNLFNFGNPKNVTFKHCLVSHKLGSHALSNEVLILNN